MRITPEIIKAFSNKDDDKLRSLLGLKPWEISPLDAVGECDYPPGSAAASTWPQARALREELLKAGRSNN